MSADKIEVPVRSKWDCPAPLCWIPDECLQLPAARFRAAVGDASDLGALSEWQHRYRRALSELLRSERLPEEASTWTWLSEKECLARKETNGILNGLRKEAEEIETFYKLENRRAEWEPPEGTEEFREEIDDEWGGLTAAESDLTDWLGADRLEVLPWRLMRRLKPVYDPQDAFFDTERFDAQRRELGRLSDKYLPLLASGLETPDCLMVNAKWDKWACDFWNYGTERHVLLEHPLSQRHMAVFRWLVQRDFVRRDEYYLDPVVIIREAYLAGVRLWIDRVLKWQGCCESLRDVRALFDLLRSVLTESQIANTHEGPQSLLGYDECDLVRLGIPYMLTEYSDAPKYYDLVEAVQGTVAVRIETAAECRGVGFRVLSIALRETSRFGRPLFDSIPQIRDAGHALELLDGMLIAFLADGEKSSAPLGIAKALPAASDAKLETLAEKEVVDDEDRSILVAARDLADWGIKPTGEKIAGETNNEGASGAFNRRLKRLKETGYLKNKGTGRSATGYLLTDAGRTALEF